MLRLWFSFSAVPELISYIALFVGVMIVFEHGILSPLEDHDFRWRA